MLRGGDRGSCSRSTPAMGPAGLELGAGVVEVAHSATHLLRTCPPIPA